MKCMNKNIANLLKILFNYFPKPLILLVITNCTQKTLFSDLIINISNKILTEESLSINLL